jgi:hypothetical protein
VFGVALSIPLRLRSELTLDGEVLDAFGSLPVPGNVWRSLQRLGSWVEPVLGSVSGRASFNREERLGGQ